MLVKSEENFGLRLSLAFPIRGSVEAFKMMSQGFKVLWLLTTYTALLLCTAWAQEGNSEAYSHKNFGTTLYSSYNFLKCTTDLHLTPTSTQEVSYLIKLHTSSTEPVKIRATRPGFHSGAGFVCAGKRDNTKKEFKAAPSNANSHPQSVSMLLHLMNHVVSVDPVHHQLTIEAGMTLLDLANAAEANNMSIRAGAFSVYSNLTVGGIVSASAHGTGLGTISSLGMLVRKIKWVNAKGEIIVSDSETDNTEVNALIGGLGLLGIITEITLQLEANSRTIIEAREDLNDANIVADLKHMLKHETPHIIAFWRPDLGSYRVQMFTHVGADEILPTTAPAFQATGRNSYLPPILDQSARVLGGLLAAWEGDIADESATADKLNAGICSVEEPDKRTPLFTDEDGTLIHRATVPTNYAMFGPDCSPKCIFTIQRMKISAEDMEFTIKASQLEGWVEDVRVIIQTELQEVQERLDKRYGKGKVRRCLPPGKIWMRFGKGSKGFLATSAGTEDVAFVQWSSLTSASASKPGKQFTMIQTIEQLSLCKYKARPHWGKNHERVFRHPKCHVRDNFPAANVEQILKLQQRHDPRKVFEPELFTHVLQKHGPDYSELCTLHYWCYCEEDSHCPDGHACQRSPPFPEHKVCRVVTSNKHDEL